LWVQLTNEWPNLVRDYKELPQRENITENLLKKMKIAKVHGRPLNRGRDAPVKEAEPSQRRKKPWSKRKSLEQRRKDQKKEYHNIIS